MRPVTRHDRSECRPRRREARRRGAARRGDERERRVRLSRRRRVDDAGCCRPRVARGRRDRRARRATATETDSDGGRSTSHGHRDRGGDGEQIAALQACADAEGATVTYVKPHGALYHRAAVDDGCAAGDRRRGEQATGGIAGAALPARFGAARLGRGSRAPPVAEALRTAATARTARSCPRGAPRRPARRGRRRPSSRRRSPSAASRARSASTATRRAPFGLPRGSPTSCRAAEFDLAPFA